MNVTSIQRIKRVRANFGPDDPRLEIQTPMAAFYVVPEVIVVEYDETRVLEMAVFQADIRGERYRRLKNGVKPTGSVSMSFYGGSIPMGLLQVVRDLWWEGKEH